VKIIVPEDHGTTDVLAEQEQSAVVRPHDHLEDTYVAVWFYFQALNDTGQDLAQAQIVIQELPTGHDTYEPFWKHCFWSRDGEHWERIPAEAQRFGTDTLTITTSLQADASLWIAETFPLPYGRYLQKCEQWNTPPPSGLHIRRERLGESVQGRPIYGFHVQREAQPEARSLLLLAGQHAVEQSGRIFAETILSGYHSGAFANTALETLLQTHNVVIVPLANPDGCYDGRMNSNAAGTIMDSPADNSPETLALLALVDAIRPQVMVNCHGWGNEVGTRPHEDLYRWTDEDGLFAYLWAKVPGCSSTGSPHWLADHFRLESHARAQYDTACTITELNWNWYIPPEGGPARQPTWEDIEARAIAYFTAIAEFCIQSATASAPDAAR
jgi:hypothetical protein